MRNTIETFCFTDRGVEFNVDVICYDENTLFEDEWEMTDTHQGGVTVKNKNADRNSYKFAIPLQYSLAERTANLLAQGVPADKASGKAYEDAQDALSRDLSACDYGFLVTANIGGLILMDSENVGCSFNYSPEDNEDLLDVAQDVFNENGIKEDAIQLAHNYAQEKLNAVDALQTYVKSFGG
jgi:hypothetical protein